MDSGLTRFAVASLAARTWISLLVKLGVIFVFGAEQGHWSPDVEAAKPSVPSAGQGHLFGWCCAALVPGSRQVQPPARPSLSGGGDWTEPSDARRKQTTFQTLKQRRIHARSLCIKNGLDTLMKEAAVFFSPSRAELSAFGWLAVFHVLCGGTSAEHNLPTTPDLRSSVRQSELPPGAQALGGDHL